METFEKIMNYAKNSTRENPLAKPVIFEWISSHITAQIPQC
jgi:hypothetical protein